MSENNFLIWLKQELNLRNISIRGIARKSGFSASYVSDVLAKKKPVTWNFCVSMAEALNEPVWKLATQAGLLKNLPEDATNDDKTRALIQSFYELPPEGQKEVIEYIKWIGVKYRKHL